MHKLITVNTDDATIRFYEGRARNQGIPEAALQQLKIDIATLAVGLESVCGHRFQLSCMTSEAK